MIGLVRSLPRLHIKEILCHRSSGIFLTQKKNKTLFFWCFLRYFLLHLPSHYKDWTWRNISNVLELFELKETSDLTLEQHSSNKWFPILFWKIMLECNLPVVKNYLNRITLCFFFLNRTTNRLQVSWKYC